MKNYVYTFYDRTFSFKFYTKNVFSDLKKFINENIKKKYNVIKIEENKANNFIIAIIKEKKTLLDIKNEINLIIQDSKKTFIQFEQLQSQYASQIASLVTNFNIPEFQFLNKYLSDDLEDEEFDISENLDDEKNKNTKNNKNFLSSDEKETINNYVFNFLDTFKHYVKNSILDDYDDKEIDEMILSFCYNIKLKKLIIIIPLKIYNEIIIKFLKQNNFDLDKFDLNKIDQNNAILNNDSFIIFNYEKIKVHFMEYMNVCNICKKYHKIFNKNSAKNELVKTCIDVCTKCNFSEIKNNKKTEHVCKNNNDSKDENNKTCYVCKFYYKKNYNHIFKSADCQHLKTQLKNFIINNRIDAILYYKSKSKKMIEEKKFILKTEDYPDLLQNKKKSLKIIDNKEKNNDSSDSENEYELQSNNVSINLNKIEKEKKNSASELSNISNISNISSESLQNNVIKKINKTHNYEIYLNETEDINVNDVVDIKIYIKGKWYNHKIHIN